MGGGVSSLLALQRALTGPSWARGPEQALRKWVPLRAGCCSKAEAVC